MSRASKDVCDARVVGICAAFDHPAHGRAGSAQVSDYGTVRADQHTYTTARTSAPANAIPSFWSREQRVTAAMPTENPPVSPLRLRCIRTC